MTFWCARTCGIPWRAESCMDESLPEDGTFVLDCHASAAYHAARACAPHVTASAPELVLPAPHRSTRGGRYTQDPLVRRPGESQCIRGHVCLRTLGVQTFSEGHSPGDALSKPVAADVRTALPRCASPRNPASAIQQCRLSALRTIVRGCAPPPATAWWRGSLGESTGPLCPGRRTVC